MKKKKILLSVLSACLVTLSISTTTFASENKISSELQKMSDQQLIDVEINGDDIVISAGEEIENKEEYFKAIEEGFPNPSETNLKTARSGGGYSIGDRDSIDVGDGSVSSRFSSTIDWDYVKSSKVSGTSGANWSGGKPSAYCTTIGLTDTINFSGPVVSVTIGSGAGSGWTTSNQTATWTKSYSNKFTIDHTFKNITCVGYDLYIKETSTGEFEFGTDNYTTTASDSQWL